MEKLTKLSLVLSRGAKCEECKCSRWKGKSIITGLVVTRKDRTKEYSEENAILVCRMCFYEKGYNKRTRRTKAQIQQARQLQQQEQTEVA